MKKKRYIKKVEWHTGRLIHLIYGISLLISSLVLAWKLSDTNLGLIILLHTLPITYFFVEFLEEGIWREVYWEEVKGE